MKISKVEVTVTIITEEAKSPEAVALVSELNSEEESESSIYDCVNTSLKAVSQQENIPLEGDFSIAVEFEARKPLKKFSSPSDISPSSSTKSKVAHAQERRT